MKTIRVFGDLAKKLGQRVFKAEVNSIAEAIRFLVTNFPFLETYMLDRDYCVFAGTLNVGPEHLHYPVSVNEDILICPVIAGAGAIGRIIAGIGLLALSFIVPGSFVLFGVGVAGLFGSIGAALVLGGLAQLLAPTPTFDNPLKDKEVEELKGYNFSGIQNTSNQGVVMPVVYGEIVTGSIVVSAGIDIEDIGTDGESPFGYVFGTYGLG